MQSEASRSSTAETAMEPGASHPVSDQDMGHDPVPDLCHDPNPDSLSPAAAFSAKLLRAFEYFRNPPRNVSELDRCYLLPGDWEGWGLLPVRYVRGRIWDHSAPLPDALEKCLQYCSCLVNGPELFYTDDDDLLATFWAKFHAISAEYICHEAPRSTPVPEMRDFLYDPFEYYFLSRELGELVIEQRGHWIGVISEPTIYGLSMGDTPAPSMHEYILINEILACIALIFRQINDPVWDPSLTPELKSWNFTGEGRIIKATVVSFTNTYSRVVQASCDLTSQSPELFVSVAADICIHDMWTDFDIDIAREIVRWIIQPDDPNSPVPSTSLDPSPFPVGSGKGGRRVPSGSSDGSRDSQPSSSITKSFTANSISSVESIPDMSGSSAAVSKSLDPADETSTMAESTISVGEASDATADQASDITMELSSVEREASVSTVHTPDR